MRAPSAAPCGADWIPAYAGMTVGMGRGQRSRVSWIQAYAEMTGQGGKARVGAWDTGAFRAGRGVVYK